ncbi:hypothetical protein EXIGLDRAFT_666731 [Exidia glandulosa HHB12029]|uniref:Zinc finger PHD-type domain-containing protein n=1 Tax=Exidia glandulosa HHB12029 TaxID=1314781 RepID=A0A165NLJ1_EXIGL|nr:hypothetical protein EXIGLDRAFT_666731 [Exidia glandulosa HHB12029]
MRQLTRAGLSETRVNALLNPNDKQDVPLAYSLLVAVMNMAPPESTRPIAYQKVRRALNLLGFSFGCWLRPYTTLSMSVSKQFESLSAGAHLWLSLYAEGRGQFVPVQLFGDVMHMVKNAAFSLAKTQVDNPSGDYHLTQEGTDKLEDEFGDSRCMVGSDPNFDIQQGARRLTACVETAILFAEHPEWDRKKKRLHLSALDEQGSMVDRRYDHISPRSWTGDVNVSRVSLITTWNTGRMLAEEKMRSYGTEPPFADMEKKGNIDILHPLGRPCFNGDLLDGEVDEEPEIEVVAAPSRITGVDSDELDPEDIAAAELAELAREQDGPRAAAEPWVYLTPGDTTSKVFKASVMRMLTDPLNILGPGSTDRLKRVRGYKRYDLEPTETPESALSSADGDQPALLINDVAATLLRCCNIAFLAIIQVSSLRVKNRPSQSLHGPELSAATSDIGFQVLRVLPCETTDQSAYDWTSSADSVRFGSSDKLLWTTAPLVQPLDPVTRLGNGDERPLLQFTSAELCAVTLLLLEKVEADHTIALPIVATATHFPYKLNDSYCFAARKPDDSVVGVDKLKCTHCKSSKIKIDGVSDLLNHNAAHLLYDPKFKKSVEYCGFCLDGGGLCRFHLLKPGGVDAKGQQVNVEASTCSKLQKFSYAAAAKSKKSSPSSNIPMPCPVCKDPAPVVWRYNLAQHIAQHHRNEDVSRFKHLWTLSREEKDGLSKVWDRVTNARNTRASKAMPTLKLSDAHSSLLAMRIEDLGTDTTDHDDTPMGGQDASDTGNTTFESAVSAHNSANEPTSHHFPAFNSPTVAPSLLPLATSNPAAASCASAPPPASAAVLAVPAPPASPHLQPTAQLSGAPSSISPSVHAVITAAAPTVSQASAPASSKRSARNTGKRKVNYTFDDVCFCDAGQGVSIDGDDPPPGMVECVQPGCSTRWFHIVCALDLAKTRELPPHFMCPNCKKDSDKPPAKRARRAQNE